MICPKCRAEYREGYTICADCQVELAEELELAAENGIPIPGKSIANEVFIRGRKLVCPICAGIHFTSKISSLKNDGLNYLNDGWESQNATVFICNECGYIFWFANPEHKLFSQTRREERVVIDYETSPAENGECPNCFNKMQPGATQCGYCGYKFNEH